MRREIFMPRRCDYGPQNSAVATTPYDGLNYRPYRAAYGNGYFVIPINNNHILVATNPSGTWTDYTLSFDHPSSYYIKFVNGYFFMTYTSGAWGSPTKYYYTANPTGAWAYWSLPSDANFNGPDYVNGKWVYCKDTYVYYADTLGGAFTGVDLTAYLGGDTLLDLCGDPSSGKMALRLNTSNSNIVATNTFPTGFSSVTVFGGKNLIYKNGYFMNTSMYATDPTGPWSYTEVRFNGNSLPGARIISNDAGTLFFAVYGEDSTSDYEYMSPRFTNDPKGGVWHTFNDNILTTADLIHASGACAYGNGYWIFGGKLVNYGSSINYFKLSYAY